VSDVAIIDNGGANIASLRYALERLGASSHLTSDADELRRARRVILPGVGAAPTPWPGCAPSGSRADSATHQPVLGICLGMQLLFASSEESDDGGDTECLGLVASESPASRHAVTSPYRTWVGTRCVS